MSKVVLLMDLTGYTEADDVAGFSDQVVKMLGVADQELKKKNPVVVKFSSEREAEENPVESIDEVVEAIGNVLWSMFEVLSDYEVDKKDDDGDEKTGLQRAQDVVYAKKAEERVLTYMAVLGEIKDKLDGKDSSSAKEKGKKRTISFGKAAAPRKSEGSPPKKGKVVEEDEEEEDGDDDDEGEEEDEDGEGDDQ